MAAQATAPSHEEICSLLESSGYDPTTVSQLEAYAKAQVETLYGSGPGSGARYCFEANRTLAKQYQFFPHLADEACTSLVLLLALLEFPSTDFCALTCLVPERVQEREPCATLARCSDLLEQCQFAEFWVNFRRLVIAEGAPELLKGAAASPAAVRKIRRSILDLLSLTYRSAPLTAVLPALDMKDGAALEEFLKTDASSDRVVESVGADGVTFVPTEENTKRSRVFKEGVNFDAISAMMAKGTQLAQQ